MRGTWGNTDASGCTDGQATGSVCGPDGRPEHHRGILDFELGFLLWGRGERVVFGERCREILGGPGSHEPRTPFPPRTGRVAEPWAVGRGTWAG